MGAYKKIAFLAPHPSLTLDQFRHHWRNVHGPLVADSPGYINYRLRYVQNHVLRQGPVGRAFGHPGIAEFWLPGNGSNEAAFSATPTYRDHIKPDEENFIDMAGTIAMSAVEEIFVAGSGPCKVIVVSPRSVSLGASALQAAYQGYAGQLRDIAPFAGRVIGWRVDFVRPGTFTLPGAGPSSGLAVDCVEAFWFADEDAMISAFAALADDAACGSLAVSVFDVERRASFIAEELVFFDRVPLRAEG